MGSRSSDGSLLFECYHKYIHVSFMINTKQIVLPLQPVIDDSFSVPYLALILPFIVLWWLWKAADVQLQHQSDVFSVTLTLLSGKNIVWRQVLWSRFACYSWFCPIIRVSLLWLFPYAEKCHSSHCNPHPVFYSLDTLRTKEAWRTSQRWISQTTESWGICKCFTATDSMNKVKPLK